jgi:hypothetical protein
MDWHFSNRPEANLIKHFTPLWKIYKLNLKCATILLLRIYCVKNLSYRTHKIHLNQIFKKKKCWFASLLILSKVVKSVIRLAQFSYSHTLDIISSSSNSSSSKNNNKIIIRKKKSIAIFHFLQLMCEPVLWHIKFARPFPSHHNHIKRKLIFSEILKQQI